MTSVLITLALSLIIIFILTEISNYFKFPAFTGQIIAGVILGIPFLNNLIIGSNTELISSLGELGIIFLMFLTGFSIKFKKMKKSFRIFSYLAIISAITTFILGFTFMKFFGFSNLSSLVVAICLSITAEGTNASTLLQLKKLNTRIGLILVGAGLIDDFIGLVGFLIIAIFSGVMVSPELFQNPFMLISGVVFFLIIFKIIPKLIRYEEREKCENKEISLFMTSTILILLFAVVGKQISGDLSGSVISAFFAGIIIQNFMNHKAHENIKNYFRLLSLSLIIPFFFLDIGMRFNLSALTSNPFLIIFITIIAISGKMLGAVFSKKLGKFSWNQIFIIGAGMNSRGAIELVIALLAFQTGILSQDLYSAIVVMTFITTALFPFILKNSLKLNKKVLN